MEKLFEAAAIEQTNGKLFDLVTGTEPKRFSIRRTTTLRCPRLMAGPSRS